MRRRWLVGSVGALVLIVAAFLVWTQITLAGELVLRNLLGQSAAYLVDEDGRIVAILPQASDISAKSHDAPLDRDRLDGPLDGLAHLHEHKGLDSVMGSGVVQGPNPSTVLVTIHQEYFSKGTGSTAEIADALRAMGVAHLKAYETYLIAAVPVGQLAEVAELDHVQFVEARSAALLMQSSNPASPNSDPFNVHGINDWHQAGYTGQGIKIGIIDSGFSGYDELETKGILPSATFVCFRAFLTFTVGTRQNCLTHDRHGTAVAEAISRIAPDASLYLVQLSPAGDLRAAVEWLIGQDVDIINMSLGFRWDGPGDISLPKRSSKLSVVDEAVDNGIVWINAAGNENKVTWSGQLNTDPKHFKHTNPSTLDWGPLFPPNTCHTVTLHGRQHLQVQMRWDDPWHRPTIDLDIHVYDVKGNKIAGLGGEQTQGGQLFPGRPLERFSSWAPLDAGVYCVQIHNASAVKTPASIHRKNQVQLHLWDADGELIPYSGSGSILNPAESASPGLLAVGAAPIDNPQQIADYSSRGLTMDGRIKPDLVGVAEVYSEAVSSAFTGTSQAAPHVAGMAALVKQRFPQFSATQIAGFLRDQTAHPGRRPDSTWGFGLAQLPSLTTASAIPTPVQPSQVEDDGAIGQDSADAESSLPFDSIDQVEPLRIERPGPVTRTSNDQYVSVSAGTNHTCGLKPDNAVVCWDSSGSNTFVFEREIKSILALPGTSEAPGTTNIWRWSCGLLRDGTAFCWDTLNAEDVLRFDGTYSDLNMLSFNLCGLRLDNTIQCYGGLTNSIVRDDLASANWSNISQFSGGMGALCGVNANGTLLCASVSEERDSAVVTRVPSGQFRSVSVGLSVGGVACGIQTDGRVVCWGDSGIFGELADPPQGRFKSVSTGMGHACGIRDNNTVACWGNREAKFDNQHGEASPPEGLFNAISVNWHHSCALRTDSRITCWGRADLVDAMPNSTKH